MKDDYLWDGTGEVDPEIERLEMTLRQFKHQPRPLALPTSRPRPQLWFGLAAAAVLLIALTAGLSIYFSSPNGDPQTAPAIAEQGSAPQPPQPTAPPVTKPTPQPETGRHTKVNQPSGAPVVASNQLQNRRAVKAIAPTRTSDEAATIARQPIVIPFLDAESARHIEKSQLLLRAFNNLRLAGGETVDDVAYERQAGQQLLEKNIRLRRTAEARGNLPVEDLLGSIEPILLDISNLPERPSGQEVRAIKTRIQEREMIASLQIYLGSVPNVGR